jgi:hypothetical protein
MITTNLKAIGLIEEFWHLNDRFPTEAEICLVFPDFDLASALADPHFVNALHNRGITPPVEEKIWRPSPVQMAAMIAVTNYTDVRSRQEKLEALGVNLNTWAGWLRNKSFKLAFERLSRQNFEESSSIAREGLSKAMERGEVAAIKYFNDLTGEAPQVQNLQLMLTKLVEVIQLHVTDQATLAAIERDFRLIMSGQSIDRILIEGGL